MKVIRILAIVLVSMGMAMFLACSEEKTASLEGNEDIVAVLKKIPECMNNVEIAMEIYTNDAILMYQAPSSGKMVKIIGPKEIGVYRSEVGKNVSAARVSINNVVRVADTAHVKFTMTTQTSQGLEVDENCSAEMVKEGKAWRIKKETDEFS